MTETTPAALLTVGLKKVGWLWVVVTSVLGSLLLVAIVGLVVVSSKSGTADSSAIRSKVITQGGVDRVAVVDIAGVITDEGTSSDPFAVNKGTASVRQLKKVLAEVGKDDQVKAVVLRINSPGGAVVASDELYLAIKELAAKKPVVAQLTDLAASGGYYAALGATKIVANQATITGSIGVIAQFPEVTDLLNKVGVSVHTIKSGKFKDIGSPNRPLTAEDEAIMQAIITDAYDQFVAAVVSGRNLSEAKVRSLADGRIYSGKQAKEAGLVDELGTFETALASASSLAQIHSPTVVEYHDQSLWAQLFSSAQAANPTAELAKLVPSSQFGVYYLMSL